MKKILVVDNHPAMLQFMSSLLEKEGHQVLSAEDGKVEGLDNQLFTSIIAAAAEKKGARAIILSHNNSGKALAPRLSVKLKAGLASGVTSLPESADPFIVTKKVFSGKAYSRIKINTDRVILTLAQTTKI